MLDRTIAPELKKISPQSLPPYEVLFLETGTPVYYIPYPNMDVMSVEINFDACACNEQKSGLSSFTAKLLSEGTKFKSSFEVSQILDNLGSYFNVETNIDFSTVSVHNLTENFDKTINLTEEILKFPAFSEEEFDSLLARLYQSITVEEKKTAWQARRLFMNNLFGSKHPYANTVGREELNKISRDEIIDFYKQKFDLSNSFVVVAGGFNQKRIHERLEKLYSNTNYRSPEWGKITQQPETNIGLEVIKMEGYMQSSVRTGFHGFNRNHPDVYKMRVVNTILGGYFGSRLMSNIREEKGYTYGIGSAWITNKSAGYFTCASDVGSEFTKDTLIQIRIEMEKMRQEKVSEAELEIVKNYMLGKLVADLETPFQIADRLKYSVVYGLDAHELEKNFNEIQNASVDDILNLAQKYFDLENMVEVVCGSY